MLAGGWEPPALSVVYGGLTLEPGLREWRPFETGRRAGVAMAVV